MGAAAIDRSESVRMGCPKLMAVAARPGASIMSADLDDLATSTSIDVQEAQWRAGVNRQAQPEAQSHQVAAALALGAKRKSNAMTAEQRAANRNAGKRARYAAAKQERERVEAAHADTAAEATIAEVVAGLVDDVVAQRALGALKADEHAAPESWLRGDELTYDTLCDWRGSHDYNCFTLERDAHEWEAAGRPQDSGKLEYCLPWQELKDRIDEGLEPLDREPQFEWDARVAAMRAQRGTPLGDYLTFDAIVAGEYLNGVRA